MSDSEGAKPDLSRWIRTKIGAQLETALDDSKVLPAVSKFVKPLGYGPVGEKIGRGGEHSVRNLGEKKIVKLGEPDDADLIRGFIDWSQYVLNILKERIPNHLPETEIHYVDLKDGQACYVVVMDKVRGRGLSQVKDEELPLIRQSLLEILKVNQQLHHDHGLSLDLTAVDELSHPIKSIDIGTIVKGIPRVVDPRYSNNYMATIDDKGKLDGNIMITDPIIYPNKYEKGKFPKRFWNSSLWYGLVVPPMFRAQQRLIDKLEPVSS